MGFIGRTKRTMWMGSPSLHPTYSKFFFEKIVEFLERSNKLVKNKSKEEEEDKVRWMRRMRRDRFFRKCRKK